MIDIFFRNVEHIHKVSCGFLVHLSLVDFGAFRDRSVSNKLERFVWTLWLRLFRLLQLRS